VFQPLERIEGDWESIANRILELSTTDSQAWLEVSYDGEEIIADLRDRLEAAVADSRMEILRIRNNRIIARAMWQMGAEETLDDLDADEVFERCLTVHEVSEEQRPELRQTYREIVLSIQQGDSQTDEGGTR
jgi:exonuclease SbcD